MGMLRNARMGMRLAVAASLRAGIEQVLALRMADGLDPEISCLQKCKHEHANIAIMQSSNNDDTDVARTQLCGCGCDDLDMARIGKTAFSCLAAATDETLMPTPDRVVKGGCGKYSVLHARLAIHAISHGYNQHRPGNGLARSSWLRNCNACYHYVNKIPRMIMMTTRPLYVAIAVAYLALQMPPVFAQDQSELEVRKAAPAVHGQKLRPQRSANGKDIRRIQTRFARLEIIGKAGLCTVFLNGKVLDEPMSADITVFPGVRNAQLAILETAGGGNCCPPEWSVVDLTSANARPVKVPGQPWAEPKWTYLKAAGKFRPSISARYTPYTDEIGDKAERTYTFIPEIAAWIEQGTRAKYLKYVGKYPEELLADREARETVIALLGKDRFGEFREKAGVQTPSSLAEGRYYVATGCTPHNCGDTLGILIIDTITDASWVIFLDDRNVQAAGTVSRMDEKRGLLAVIDRILSDHDTFKTYRALSDQGKLKVVKR